MTEKVPERPTLSREFLADIEVRSSAEGRTVAGRVVPFGTTAVVSDGGRPYKEQFARGAFARFLSNMRKPVPLLMQHDRSRDPVGSSLLLREDEDGLYGEFKVSETRAGTEALELIRDGALSSFSIGFAGVQYEKRGDVVVRTEAAIRETSIVTFPAYADAEIQSVRAQLLGLSDADLTLLAERMSAINTSLTTPSDQVSADTAIAAVLSATDPPPQHSVRNIHLNLRALAREIGAL